ncbi:hypothetical protein [Streptomyces hiroshimensis]
MTERRRPDSHDEVVDRWLIQCHNALVDGLGTVLDVESGLEEILLQSCHHTLVHDLAAVLDVEGGLAAIVPTAASLPPTANPEVSVAQLLRSVSPRIRIALRSHQDVVTACHALDRALEVSRLVKPVPDRHLDLDRDLASAMDLNLGLAGDLVGILVKILDPARDHAHDLARDRARCLAVALNSARDRASDHRDIGNRNRDLERALDLARTFAYGLADDLSNIRVRGHDRDLVRARDLARALTISCTLAFAFTLASALHHGQGLGPAFIQALDGVLDHAHDLVAACLNETWRVIGVVLGRDIPDLDEGSLGVFLDDFTESDLRLADLGSVDLAGVRWSMHRTLWPARVDVEDLMSRSEENPAGSGVYVVQSGTATLRDLAELT